MTRIKKRQSFVFFRPFSRLNFLHVSAILIFCLTVAAGNSFAQKAETKVSIEKNKSQQTVSNLPKVTQIDAEALKKLIVPNGKPLLINFWATWCDPCREEFPDLVQIGLDYKDKIDLITVSLDDLAEIKTGVPQFLAAMKADKMPAYLLKTSDEGAAIAMVSKDWQGGLPFTILFNEKGETVYTKMGKFNTAFLKAEIEKSLVRENKSGSEIITVADFVKIKNGKRDEAIFYYENNWKIYREIALKKGFIHSYEIIETKPDASAANTDFDLILITRYADEKHYQDSEKNFQPILKEVRPNGAMLKNDLKPEDFRQNVFAKVGKNLISSAK